jgi:Fur family transcriptional regulator, ferric uptake regulator
MDASDERTFIFKKLVWRQDSIDFRPYVKSILHFSHFFCHILPLHSFRNRPKLSLEMDILLEQLLNNCKNAGLRQTKSLVALLKTLVENQKPTTLAELIESPRLHSLCDKVTVYRLLQRLSEKGLVRRLGLHERSAYFSLLIPGSHQDYLICTSCNDIQAIKAPCPVHALEKELADKTGYRGLYHELEFFGTCPLCASSL